MGKYTPLKEYLLKQRTDLVPMTFAEIEAVLNASLPASKRYPAWWSNNEFNNTMTSEWLAAGYQTEAVDVSGEKLVFRKVKRPSSSHSASSGATTANEVPHKKKAAGRLPFFGFMKGKMTIEPGYDITQPIDMDWENPYLGDDRAK
ncbi:MAG: DUF7662 domain-containing protein [Rhizobiaceae bacterium]